MATIPKKKASLVLSLLILTLVLTGCHIFDSDRRDRTRALDSDVIFNLSEGYKDYLVIDEPRIRLLLRTEVIYGCCNYSILSDVSFEPRGIGVDIRGIYTPEICLTATGPAKYSLLFDIQNGIYLLTFSNGDFTDRYTLEVTDSFIRISEVASQFTKPEYKLYWRYPPNSFAYLCGTTHGTMWIWEDFLNVLLDELELEKFEFPNTGVIPYPHSTSGYYVNMPGLYFTYDDETDFEKAGELLKAYSKDVISNYSGVGITLVNWKNKRYLSWLYTE